MARPGGGNCHVPPWTRSEPLCRHSGTRLNYGHSGPSQGHTAGLTSATFYEQLRCHLKKAGIAPAGVHTLRHTAAKLRRDAGESIETVSRFLDHSSLAVTTTYLRRLEDQEDKGWGTVAEAIDA